MDIPSGLISPLELLAIAGIVAVVVVKIARLRAARSQQLPEDVAARLETLETDVQRLQNDLSETQERLDFAERVLVKAREEGRIGV